jgi:hypothetical protein
VSKKRKRNLAIELIKRFKGKIMQGMNSRLRGEGVQLTVKDLDVNDATAKGLELEFRLRFDDIDYAALITWAREYGKNSIEGVTYLELLYEIFGDRISQKLDAYSEDEKEAIVAAIVNVYEDKIAQLLSEFVEKEGLVIKFSKPEIIDLHPDVAPKKNFYGKLIKAMGKLYITGNKVFPLNIPEKLTKIILRIVRGHIIDINEIVLHSVLGIWGLFILARDLTDFSRPWLYALSLILLLIGCVAYWLCILRQKNMTRSSCEVSYDYIPKNVLIGLAWVYFPTAAVIFMKWIPIYIHKYDLLFICIYVPFVFLAPIFYIYLIISGVISCYAMTVMSKR